MSKKIVGIFIILCSLLFSFTLHANPQPKTYDHLIIYVDVNRTILACDKAQGKGVESSLDSSFSQKISLVWDERYPSMDYYSYVYEVVVPGNRNEPGISQKRKEALKNFWPALQKTSPQLYSAALAEKQAVLAKLEKDPTAPFPAFYELLDALNQSQIPHTVVFRSFGDDYEDVSTRLLKEKRITIPLVHFKEKSLVTEKGELSQLPDIYNYIKAQSFLWIKDDYPYWASHQEQAAFSKMFPIDSQDDKTLSIFFDDNLLINKPDDSNIVYGIDVSSGERVSMETLIDEGFAYKVDMVTAILQDSYFTDRVFAHMEKTMAEETPIRELQTTTP